MKFLDIVKEIQELQENEGYLVLVRCGIFFNAIEKDGVIVAEKFGYKPTCAKNQLCKCGIPVKTIDRFINSIIEKKIALAIYDYMPDRKAKENNKNYELLSRITLCPIEEYRTYLDCNACWFKDRRLKEGKEIINDAIKKLKEIDNINMSDI